MRICTYMLLFSLCAFTARAVAQTTDGSTSSQTNGVTTQVVKMNPVKTDAPALRTKAKALRKISESKPGTKEAREASVEEVEVLVKLAFTKDADLADRKRQLVTQLKQDEAVPTATRFRLAALSANIEVAANRSLDPDQKMAAYAKVAWQLAADFPDQPEAFAGLVRIARDSNDEQANKIAEALIDSKASMEVKQAAADILERSKLIGQSLKDIVGDQLELPSTGKICVAVWTAQQPQSLDQIESLASSLLSDTAVVALCVDGDSTAAASIAAAKKNASLRIILPAGGSDSALFKALKIGGRGMYITDDTGKIATVLGGHALALMKWQKAQEASR